MEKNPKSNFTPTNDSEQIESQKTHTEKKEGHYFESQIIEIFKKKFEIGNSETIKDIDPKFFTYNLIFFFLFPLNEQVETNVEEEKIKYYCKCSTSKLKKFFEIEKKKNEKDDRYESTVLDQTMIEKMIKSNFQGIQISDETKNCFNQAVKKPAIGIDINYFNKYSIKIILTKEKIIKNYYAYLDNKIDKLIECNEVEINAIKEKFVYFVFNFVKDKYKKKKLDLKIFFPNDEEKKKFHETFPFETTLVYFSKDIYELDGFFMVEKSIQFKEIKENVLWLLLKNENVKIIYQNDNSEEKIVFYEKKNTSTANFEKKDLYLQEIEKEELFTIRIKNHIIFEIKNNDNLKKALKQVRMKYPVFRKFDKENEVTYLIPLAEKPSKNDLEFLMRILDEEAFKNIKIIVLSCLDKKFLGLDINKNIKDQELEEVKNDINLMKNDINLMKNDINLVKNDINLMKNDINLMKNNINKIENDVDEIKNDMNEIKNDMKILINIFKKKFTEEFTLEEFASIKKK